MKGLRSAGLNRRRPFQKYSKLHFKLRPAHPNTTVKLPTFSGEFNEDVNEFLTNFDRAANFHNWQDLKKAQALPLHLKGNASIWFNTSPGLVDKTYPELTAALKEQFHSASDKWWLRQKLNDRKQLPTESVSEYASDIR